MIAASGVCWRPAGLAKRFLTYSHDYDLMTPVIGA